MLTSRTLNVLLALLLAAAVGALAALWMNARDQGAAEPTTSVTELPSDEAPTGAYDAEDTPASDENFPDPRRPPQAGSVQGAKPTLLAATLLGPC